MKKSIFFCCFLLSLRCIAQDDSVAVTFKKALYFRAGMGYSFAWGGNSSNAGIVPCAFKTISVTKGIDATAGGGVMLGPHIGVQLDADMYMPGEKYTFMGSYRGLDAQLGTAGVKAGSIVLLTPSLMVQEKVGGVTVYSRVGPTLPAINRTTAMEWGGYPLYPALIQNKLTDYFGVGFSGTVGASYAAGKHIHIWAETSVLSMAEYVKSATIITPLPGYTFYHPQPETIKFEYKGLSTANGYTSTGGITYTGEYLYNSSSQPTFTLPYSNISLRLGVSYSLAKEQTTKEPGTNKNHVYLKCGVGYSFPMANNSGAGDITEYSSKIAGNYANNTYDVAFKGKPVSFSSGPAGIIGVGYSLSRHIGVELNLSGGFNSKKYCANQMITGISNPRGGPDTVTIAETRNSRSPVLLEPCLVLQTGADKVNIYSRIGVVLPIHLAITDQFYYDETKTGTTAQTNVVSFDFTMGFTFAAGVKFRIAGPLYVWGEVSALSLQPTIKESRTTSLFIDGKAATIQTPVEKFSHSSTGPRTQNMSYTMPFSSAGLQLGLSCRLW